MLFTAKSSVLLDKEEDGKVDDEEDETCCCVSSTDRDACMPESGYLVDSSGCLEEDMAREDFSDLS